MLTLTITMSNLTSFLQLFAPSTSNNNNNADSRRQVLTRLKFLGSIMPHEKIDSRSLKIESTSFLTPIKRFFMTGDSRDTTLHFFSSTIDRSCEIISAYLHSNNVQEQIFCANILQDLMNSVKGLRSAQITYESDKLVVCEIEVLIENIQAFIFQTQQTHAEVFTIKELCVLRIDGKCKIEAKKVENSKIIPPSPHLKSVPPPISLHSSDDEDDEHMP